MTKAMDDDVPIEARMVTKAIERAQNTVEQRNAEIRKNVLKYDEVMNEQRKVIYRRRDQILEGADLREEAIEYLADAIESVISTYCVSDYAEEWDIPGLVAEIATYWPSTLTAEKLSSECSTTDELYELLMGEAQGYYEQREEEIGSEVMREVERQIMLQIIDTKWREHLYEMDYLQEGIHLRAMGQKDPLVEWQQDGYAMFGAMVDLIAEDFVKYIMHLQVVREDQPATEVRNMQTSGPASVQGSDNIRQAFASAPVEDELGDGPAPIPNQPDTMAPVVKAEHERIGRNDPCYCGSGKKYKHCHGL